MRWDAVDRARWRSKAVQMSKINLNDIQKERAKTLHNCFT